MANPTKHGVRGYLLDKKTSEFSATRLAFLLWAAFVLIVWTVASFSSYPMQLAAIPDSVVTILGILAGTKVVQRFAEN